MSSPVRVPTVSSILSPKSLWLVLWSPSSLVALTFQRSQTCAHKVHCGDNPCAVQDSRAWSASATTNDRQPKQQPLQHQITASSPDAPVRHPHLTCLIQGKRNLHRLSIFVAVDHAAPAAAHRIGALSRAINIKALGCKKRQHVRRYGFARAVEAPSWRTQSSP